ncbi:MAG: RNA methyltransferase [Bdellovibrionaceae bacterium]|nr:RNA methyltransferase [Pseudobdellovibrionaceae bacterium]
MRSFEIRIVLVRSIYERNVGATSRAMSNMGCEKLILVDPKCELTYEAQQAAATGQTGLQNRVTYNGWPEFLAAEPESIKICMTARDGKGRQVRDLDDVLQDIKEKSPQFQRDNEIPYVVHLIFGPEDWGLSGEDLEVANFCACIPTYGDNWSLNLSQATLLTMFSLRKAWGGNRTQLDGGSEDRRAPQGIEGINPDLTLKTWLQEMGFDLSKKKINVYTVLRRMLLQNTPTKKELIILETVLQQSIRKLQEYNSLRK